MYIFLILFGLLSLSGVAITMFLFKQKEGEQGSDATDELLRQMSQIVQETSLADGEKEPDSEKEEEEDDPMCAAIKNYKSSLLTRLYAVRQQIAIFEHDFPTEYAGFLQRIETLEAECCKSLEEIQKELTFAIDPDIDSGKMGETTILEKDVERFLETKVKFQLLSNQLQRLITKLNILYNVSISHCTSEEQNKVMSQLEHAVETQKDIAGEVKSSEYILADKQLSQKLFELISYADYLILKSRVRNSNETPGELIEKLVMLTEFDGFEYAETFKSFIKDEVYDLAEFLPQIADEECRRVMKDEGSRILVALTYSESVETELWNPDFWNNLLEYESNLLEVMQTNGMSKDDAKVKLIARMDIRVKEHEVLVSPVANAYLSLTSVFSKTQDGSVLLLLKLLNGMSKEVTYKEIYFLILLFEAKEVIQSIPNSLNKFIAKYQAKYPYNLSSIREKKELVKQSSSKAYVYAFSEDSHLAEMISTLRKLNMDFRVDDSNHVLLNSFYFEGLDNVQKSLKV